VQAASTFINFMKKKHTIVLLIFLLNFSCKPIKNLYITFPKNYPQKLIIYTDLKEYAPLIQDKKGNFYITTDTTVITTSTSAKQIFYKTRTYFSINNTNQFIFEGDLPLSNKILVTRSAAGYVNSKNKDSIGYIEYTFETAVINKNIFFEKPKVH
jgi:hypothetical protein